MGTAIDDFDGNAQSAALLDGLLAVVSHVRLDLRSFDPDALKSAVAALRAQKKRLIADHIDDAAMRKLCIELGFDRLQGPHFSRPEPLPAAELPASTATALRLLGSRVTRTLPIATSSGSTSRRKRVTHCSIVPGRSAMR